MISVQAGTSEEIERSFETMARERANAAIFLTDGFFSSQFRLIAELAIKFRVATMYSNRLFAEIGGLISFGANTVDSYRRAATYVDKILKGAKPADLPVEQPTKFELAINLRTAKALGLTIPPALLLRADHVIK